MRFQRSTNGADYERSPETMERYRRTAIQLGERFLRENPEPKIHFVDWLIERNRAGHFAKRTWRVYRAAVVAYLEDDEPRQRLLAEQPVGARARGTSRRTKHVSARAFERLTKEAAKRCRPAERMADRLQAWIDAGEVTGLRPVEWANARLVVAPGGKSILVVKNAKHSHGRGHGEYREIGLLSERAVTAVRHHLALIESYLTAKPDREFRHYYESCRKGLIRLNHSLPKSAPRLSLYSTRHQFKINAREAGVDRTELAYLMGHASTGTAQRHYGRPRAKGGGFGVCATGQPENHIRQTHRELRGALDDLSMPDLAAEFEQAPNPSRGPRM